MGDKIFMGNKISDKIHDRDFDEKSLKYIADALLDRLLGLKGAYSIDRRIKLYEKSVPAVKGLLTQIMRKYVELSTLSDAKAKLERVWEVSIRREKVYKEGLKNVEFDRDKKYQRHHAAVVKVTAENATGGTFGAAGASKAVSWASEKAINKGVEKASGSKELGSDRWFDSERTLIEPFQEIWRGAYLPVLHLNPVGYYHLYFSDKDWLPNYLKEITDDDFQYDMNLRYRITTAAKSEGKSYIEAKNIQTEICYQFWSSLKETCHLILQKGDFDARMEKVRSELKQLEEQFIREMPHSIKNASPV